MTVTELLEQAQSLSPEEQKELAELILASLNDEEGEAKPAAEILALMEQLPPIEFVDDDITDPVEWVKAQRRKDNTPYAKL